MNKKGLITIVVIIIILIVLGFVLSPKKVNDKADVLDASQNMFSMQDSQRIAEEWISSSAPTYIFDGSNLKLDISHELTCGNCYKFIFSFESASAGYGWREGQELANALTSHIIAVEVKDGVVTRAVTDEQFDEIENETLIPEGGFQKG